MAASSEQVGDFVGDVILKLLCNDFEWAAPIMGDSLESASPYDATFWVIHTTVERLFSWKRINGFLNTTWPDDKAWSVKGFRNGYCWGHNKADVLTWPSYLFSETGPSGPYSNLEFWNILDPHFDYLPYIYDGFSWEHCVAAGFNASLI